jgi:SGNH domain-containing protein
LSLRRATLPAAIVLVAIAAGAPASGSAPPACFGAAARDPVRPCTNPALRRTVVPTPASARRAPNAPCADVAFDGPLIVCDFGVPAAQATATVALIGDSHATHWRAAVDAVARAKGWHGLSVTHSSCPLSTAVRPLPGADRARCLQWKDHVRSWLTRHAEVSTVFVSALAGGTGVVPSRGRDAFATAVGGYVAAWRALPESVARVIVIRDTPRMPAGTGACVGRALRARLAPGRACAVARGRALDRDPEAVAAARLRSPRVRLADLTPFMCGARSCLPVVGGALVLKDQNHLTATFAATLGPFLLRTVDRLG